MFPLIIIIGPKRFDLMKEKFTLSGLDGIACCWHERCCQERIILEKRNGRRSVMVGGCYSASGKCVKAFIEKMSI